MGEITLITHVMVSFQSLLQQAKCVSSQSRNVRFPYFFFQVPQQSAGALWQWCLLQSLSFLRVFQSVLRYTGIPNKNPACHVHPFPIFWLKPFRCIGSYMAVVLSECQQFPHSLRNTWFIELSSHCWRSIFKKNYVETIYVLRKFPWTSSKHLTKHR